MAQRDIYIGKKIGSYRIEQTIASGSFGTVYLARHVHLKERTVAIKILHTVHLGSDAEKEQFLQEAQILETLKDVPNVLPLLDIDIDDNIPYMIAKYAERGSLRMLIRQRGLPLPLQETFKIIEQVGKGLQGAHNKGIVHRDLKPENILFDAKGEALLADFGISTVLSTASVKYTQVVGTPAYMASEQFRGEVCKESDQYALACIAYELLTGRKLFDAPDFVSMGFLHSTEPPTPPRQLNPHIPISIEQALLRALEKKRTDRYSSVSAFVAALNSGDSDKLPPPIVRPPISPTLPAPSPNSNIPDTSPSPVPSVPAQSAPSLVADDETTFITPHHVASKIPPPALSIPEKTEKVWSTTPSRPSPNLNRRGAIIITLILVILLLFGGGVIFANLGLIGNTHPTTDASPTPTVHLTTTAVAAGPTCINGTIVFDGSTALYPLANAVAGSYQNACSEAAPTITSKQSGSATGLSEVSSGTVDIGNSDIFADPAKYPGLTDHQVAAVVFSVVLNGQVTGVTNLTSQQLINIYTGKTTNWRDVGGPDLPIVTVSRSPGSGTRATFDQYVLNNGNASGPNAEKSDAASLVASQSSDLAADVNGTAGAIGYVAAFYAQQNGLHTITIDGISDANANVENNSYKFWNIEHMYTKGTATGLADVFIKYVTSSSSDVAAARQANGFLALSDFTSSAISAKQVKF